MSAVEAPPEGRPLVAIVGRPNVGKSSLANRVVGRRAAVVEESPGVTRDRKVLEAEWAGCPVSVVDTGGWLGGGDDLTRSVSGQTERALRDADLVLFVTDAETGVTDEDEAVARLLRGSGATVLVVANKVDSPSREADAWLFAKLGLGDPWMVSALHGRGVGDLLDEVVRVLRQSSRESSRPPGSLETPEAARYVAAVSVVGRPNAGKSTLFNRLVDEDRSVVHDLPGTTRDSVDTAVQTDRGTFRFVDTAGMRRRSRIEAPAEFYSVVRSLQSIDNSDVALLVIDATQGVTQQDQRLAERIDAAGCPVVIVLNKWDLVEGDERTSVVAEARDRLVFLGYAPVVRVSALTGLGVHRILPAVSDALEAYHRRVPTSEVNRVVQAAQARHPAPSARVLYAVQGSVDPPTFTLFANRSLPPTYLRYLERCLREQLGFGPTPLKLRVRRRSGR